MVSELDSFIYEWGYNVQRILERRLDSLHYDLDSADAGIREKAKADIRQFELWLGRGEPQRGRGRPQTRQAEAIRALTLFLTSEKTWREIALEVYGCNHVCAKCGSRKGKPYEGGMKDGPKCISCKRLIRTTPQKLQSCYDCGGAVRDLVGRLITFLKSHDLYLPPLKDLEKLSAEEREKLLAPLG